MKVEGVTPVQDRGSFCVNFPTGAKKACMISWIFVFEGFVPSMDTHLVSAVAPEKLSSVVTIIDRCVIFMANAVCRNGYGRGRTQSNEAGSGKNKGI